MTANIRKDTHSDCWMLQRVPNGPWWGQVGDVMICKHGKIMVRTETSSTRIAGPGTDWWRTLSPIFNPIEYRRAKRALNA